MSCDDGRVDLCLDRDEDWTLTIYCQDEAGSIGTARDLSGKQAKLWIWDADRNLIIDGQVGDIGGSVTTPADERGKATGTGTPIEWVITEATINALTAEQLAQDWTYKARLSDDSDDDEGEVLGKGSIVLDDIAIPRP